MEDDEIAKILQNFEVTPKAKKQEPEEPLDLDNIEDSIAKNLNTITQLSIDSIEEVKDLAIASNDGETIAALASLITAASKQLELMSKFALQKRKMKNAEEMQDKALAHKEKLLERKHEQLKELNGGGSQQPQLQQNNFYINASREEIMERLLGDIKEKVNKQPLTIDVSEV